MNDTTQQQVTMTIVGHDNTEQVFGKQYWLDSGQLQQDYRADLTKGYARRIVLDPGAPYTALAQVRESLQVNEAMVAGVFHNKEDKVTLGTRGNGYGDITRSNDDLPWAQGLPGVMTLDCDGGGGVSTPEASHKAPQTADELLEQYESVAPGISEAYVLAPSSSAGLAVVDGDQLKVVNRWHTQVLVMDAGDIARAVDAMHKRLFINGHGWGLISEAPSTLPRTAVDTALKTSCQPVFGAPALGEGLERRCGDAVVVEGGLYDTRRIPDLSPQEITEYDRLKAEMDDRYRRKYASVYDERSRAHVTRVARDTGVSPAVARGMLQARERGMQVLTGKMRVKLDDGTSVTVNELLMGDYHGMTCRDPMEPEYGTGKAIIYTDCAPTPLIHSMAHGLGTRYLLRHDVKGMVEHLENLKRDERAESWADLAANLLIHGGQDAFCHEVVDLVKDVSGIAAAKRAFKEARTAVDNLADERANQEAFEHVQTQARAMRQVLVELDAFKLNDAISTLQDHLGDVHHHDPVMEYGGGLVVVREGAPAFVDMPDGTECPPILKFSTLKREGLRQLFEERARFWKSSAKGPVMVPAPKDLAVEILNGHTVGVPYVCGVIEHPVVRPDGTLLSQDGYDDATGLFARMTVQDCLPSDLSQGAAGAALDWLRDVFLEDFPFAEDLDQDVAVAVMLTALQRPVLPKAPGAMIDANTQSVGKTQLCQAIQVGLTGRGVPAMTLPESEEEIEKRLLASAMEGRSLVLFDNVRQGRAVSSDCIAALITGDAGFSGRVLGESRNASTPGRMMLMLSGVCISATGDFISRMLKVRLEAPTEQAMFKKYKRDLGTWVPEHRGVFLQAMLTIVLGYQQAGRPEVQGEVDATRYPLWDAMVRRALIWAGEGSAVGVCDIAEVFTVNQEEDDTYNNTTDILRLLVQWQDECCGGRPWVAGELIPKNWQNDLQVPAAAVIRERLEELFGEMFPKTPFTAAQFGRKFLASNRGLVQSDIKLYSRNKSKKGRLWDAINTKSARSRRK